MFEGFRRLHEQEVVVLGFGFRDQGTASTSRNSSNMQAYEQIYSPVPEAVFVRLEGVEVFAILCMGIKRVWILPQP